MDNYYNHREIEKKWQDYWEKNKINDVDLSDFKNKKYILTMFSYPSGDKLHIGHWYNFGPVDTYTRFLKMNGFNIFQPQGFDAFGLPAENYAIKHGIHPSESTMKNIDTMRSQLKAIGAMYDWSNEVVTCQPEYYKWTQWLFLQLYNNNLAYRKEAMVNWDPVDQTVLANEQVLSDGTSERSGAKVVQKALKQWFFKITKYAEELLKFSDINWPNKTVAMQTNWIGKSEGANITFKVDEVEEFIEVFTTRPDTLFGVTYMVISPEHPIVKKLNLQKNKEIYNYCEKAKHKSELQRTDLDKDKSGVYTGFNAINPINNSSIPIWIGDYVLISYGTGAIMAVPGHDQRDYDFAKKYNLDIKKVVDDKNGVSINDKAFTDYGFSINSDFLNKLDTAHSKIKMIEYLEDRKIGKRKITYKLKDWLISRQRYWGAPIPIVYDPEGHAHPVPEKYLPWLLPDDVEYKPKGTSPLGSSKELIERTEKIFGKGWTPEIDTMDTFVCSSWYYLRYADSSNSNKPFSKASLKWLPVDHYIGGSEHATMHLLYARFITKCLRDLKFIDFSEPFLHLFHQGMITKDGSKMSKSKGNTVSPDKFVDSYGSDTFRCYLMFMGPFDEGGDWNDKGITGVDRFLKRSYRLISNESLNVSHNNEDEYMLHNTIKLITDNLHVMKFNTSISKLMEFVNYFYEKGLSLNYKKVYVKLLSPLAPHLSEELWFLLGNEKSVFNNTWPKYDESKTKKDNVKIAVQVNGKVRCTVIIGLNDDKESVLMIAKSNPNVHNYLNNKKIIKEIYIPGKIINFVVN